MAEIPFELKLIQIDNPDELNFILGQSHFIKTVEDIHETMVTACPGGQVRPGFLRIIRSGLGAFDRHRRGAARRSPSATRWR